ncbi:MAG: protein phosphatase 2C domain-containing protein, partial [Proteobacteria bacterium]|nr:protein phosphatase 2C domain-containing protein [Pseudomonadota bacterium]
VHGTHSGIKRDKNGETYGGDNQNQVFLVADGMGGHDHGEIASAMARDNCLKCIKDGFTLEQSILKANQEIINNSKERGGDLPMGTTIVMLKANENFYEHTWVGDSRIYHYTDQQLTAITSDNSYVQELVDQDLITPEQARSHPHRNVVTQALGVTDNSEITVHGGQGKIKPGDKFLLCSDGLTEEINDQQIEDIIKKDLHPQEICDQLIIAALKSGGSDNITVLIVQFS